MSAKDIIDVFAAIVTLAMIAVVIQSPNTAGIISAVMSGFSNSLRAASGK